MKTNKYSLNHFTSPVDMPGDLVPAVNRFLKENRQGSWKLELPADLNYIYPEAAVEKAVFISNNDSGQVRPGFCLEGMHDIEIDGCGASLVVRGIPQAGSGSIDLFYSPVLPFVLENCENVVLKNFSLDWVTPHFAQAMVCESAPGEMVIEPLTSQRWWTWNGHLYLAGEGWSHIVQRLLAAEPDTGEIVRNTGDNFGCGYETNWFYEKIGENRVKVTGPYQNMPPAGKLVFMWIAGFNTRGRRSPGIFINRCRNVQLENIILYHSWGMGIIAQHSENISLKKVVVEPSGSRKFSLTADATHFVSCKGSLTIDKCRFQNMMDDGINAHGNYLRILRKTGPQSLLVRCGHPQHQGLSLLSPGDIIETLDREDMSVMDTTTVKAVNPLNFEVYEVETSSPARFKNDDLIENTTWYPDITVRNTTIRWNRARGMLLNGRGRMLVENCTLENPGAGILIETSGEWCESGAIKDLVIRNNTFVNCAHTSSWGKANIIARPDLLNPEKRTVPFHGSITVEGNTFEKVNAPVFAGEFIDKVVIRNNRLADAAAKQGLVQVKDCAEVDSDM